MTTRHRIVITTKNDDFALRELEDAFRADPVKAADAMRREELLAAWLEDRCYEYGRDAAGRVAWIRVQPGEAAELDAAINLYMHGDV